MKVVCKEDSAFKNLSEMSREQASAIVIIALDFREKQVNEKETKKEKSVLNLGLKEETKLGFYETLLYENYLQITSENF